MSQVSSYTLANQSGALFRAALNEALAAIITQASGASAPAETHPYQLWVDTSTPALTRQLKIRNADNTGWLTLPIGLGANNSFGPEVVTGAAMNLSNNLTLANAYRMWQSGVEMMIGPTPYDGTKGVAMHVGTGILRSLAGGFGFPDGSVAPTAGIIQVATAVRTVPLSLNIADEGWVQISGLSVSITPQSAQSTFVVWGQVACSTDSGPQLAALAVRRDASVLATPYSPSLRTPCDAVLPDHGLLSGRPLQSLSMLHLDSPASASSITYDIAAITTGSGIMYINQEPPAQDGDTDDTPRLQSRLIVAEIGGDLSP